MNKNKRCSNLKKSHACYHSVIFEAQVAVRSLSKAAKGEKTHMLPSTVLLWS